MCRNMCSTQARKRQRPKSRFGVSGPRRRIPSAAALYEEGPLGKWRSFLMTGPTQARVGSWFSSLYRLLRED